MYDPHAHPILFKEGLGAEQKALVEEGRALLRRFGIDPLYVRENLVWAPMRVKHQHCTASLREVVAALKEGDVSGDDRAEMLGARFGVTAEAASGAGHCGGVRGQVEVR